MNDDYRVIAEKLQQLFPKGTVQQSGKSAYIPVQAYMKRLDEAAGEFWSWRIIGTPIYISEQRAIMVTGELSLLSATRTGIGFSHFVQDPNPNSVSKYKNAVNSAESDALRNACDKYLMGWKDLAPFREWANNPGVFDIMEQEAKELIETNDVCKKCSKPLDMEDKLFLQLHNVKIPFCSEHVPNHFKKRTDK